ncbi:MAG: PcfB family protein [Catonella sp.]|uniref:PcfB family protein n=1 Tax=Catonella sp. TaxID=2382125 RepID=UPI003F9EE0A1
MVNEEVTRQVLAVKKKALNLTAREVIKLMKRILNKAEKEKNGFKEFIDKQKPTSVKDLLKKGKVETLELNDVDLKSLKRELNKNGVKFSIKKDLTTGNNIIFFQAKDEKIMEQAFKDTVAKFAGKNKQRESVMNKLNVFKDKVKNMPQKDKIKEKHQEQSL